MAINIGSNGLSNCKYGSSQISKICKGLEVLWENVKWVYSTTEISASTKNSNGGSTTLTYTPTTPIKPIKMYFRYSLASSSSSSRTITITYYTKETPGGIKQTYSDGQHGSSWPTVTVVSPANEQELTKMTIHVNAPSGVSTTMSLRIAEYYILQKSS